MAGRDRNLEISGKTIAAARAGEKAACDQLLVFVADFSLAALRKSGLLPLSECEEISQEVTVRFRTCWDPARTNDCPAALQAFVLTMAERSLVNYFRRLAGFRPC